MKSFNENYKDVEKFREKLQENRLKRVKELGKGIRKELVASLVGAGISATAVGAGMSGDGVGWPAAVAVTATAITAGGFALKSAWDVFKKSLELEKLAEESEMGLTDFGFLTPISISPKKMKEINKKYSLEQE